MRETAPPEKLTPKVPPSFLRPGNRSRRAGGYSPYDRFKETERPPTPGCAKETVQVLSPDTTGDTSIPTMLYLLQSMSSGIVTSTDQSLMPVYS